MIDIHTHILPGIDDGSPDVQTSLEMLRRSVRQGVTLCVATPHFYATRHRIKAFLEKREASMNTLMDAMDDPAELPDVAVGAEVAWFPGIAEAEGIESLCIRGTNLLLLEMPYAPWNHGVISEVRALTDRFGVVLAHLERFLDIRENRACVREIQELPLEVQVNAESLNGHSACRSVLRMIRADFVLGSDMHNADRRPPNMDCAIRNLPPEHLSRALAKEKQLLTGVKICRRRPR